MITSDKHFLWCELKVCAERDAASGVITNRYFDEGEEQGTENLLYTRDHLGSIREMTDNAVVLRARYEYDPQGRFTKISGDKESTFGFTGHLVHQPSSFLLAPYRGYSTHLGRWVNEDPIGLSGGLNLYRYVDGNPSNLSDSLGLSGSRPGGPYHPPIGVGTKCREDDSCSTISGKMWILTRMIASHTGWDRKVPPPRGGGRHSGEIADLWKQLAECIALYETKCRNNPSNFCPVPTPEPEESPRPWWRSIPIPAPPSPKEALPWFLLPFLIPILAL